MALGLLSTDPIVVECELSCSLAYGVFPDEDGKMKMNLCPALSGTLFTSGPPGKPSHLFVSYDFVSYIFRLSNSSVPPDITR